MAKQESSDSFNIIHYIVYLAVITLNGFFNLLPYRWVQSIGTLLGRAIYYLHIPRRKLTIDNIRQAFGAEKNEKELCAIARGSFENMAKVYLEVIRIPHMLKDFTRYVTIERDDITWKALQNKNGVILLVSHYGNWELMAVMAGIIGYPIYAVARPFKNRYIYNRLLKNRELTGLISLKNRGIAKEILGALRANRVVAIVFDQYPGRTGIVVPFFGRDAYTTDAVAQLASRTGAAVIAPFITRQPDGTHKIYVESPIELVNTGDPKSDCRANTILFNQMLEKWISRHPDQWFWFHKRWKKPRFSEECKK